MQMNVYYHLHHCFYKKTPINTYNWIILLSYLAKICHFLSAAMSLSTC